MAFALTRYTSFLESPFGVNAVGANTAATSLGSGSVSHSAKAM